MTYAKTTRRVVSLAALATVACTPARPIAPEATAGGDAFWSALSALCDQAFEGRVIEGTAASDASFTATPTGAKTRSRSTAATRRW
jgi:hypothetical protein